MDALLQVSWGTVFWATIAFLVVLYILKKYAWGPILKALDDRSVSIENALNEAQKARNEMATLKSGNEELLMETRNMRDQILRDAKEIGDKMKVEARERAQAEGDRMIAAARAEIDNQKKAAIVEVKNQVANLSIEIAEKLVREKLSDSERQKALNHSLINEIGSN